MALLKPTTFVAAATWSRLSLLPLASSLSTCSVLPRYHKDKVDNRVLRRFGYKDQVANFGPLPRISNDSPQIKGMKIFKPQNPWAPKRALFGQNDYIDILGTDDLHVCDTHYQIPRIHRGRNFSNPMQAMIQKKKNLENSGASQMFPINSFRLKTKLGRYYNWQMKNLDFRRWTNYSGGIKYGPAPDSFKTKYPF